MRGDRGWLQGVASLSDERSLQRKGRRLCGQIPCRLQKVRTLHLGWGLHFQGRAMHRGLHRGLCSVNRLSEGKTLPIEGRRLRWSEIAGWIEVARKSSGRSGDLELRDLQGLRDHRASAHQID